MLLATPSLLLTTVNERQAFSYEENASNTPKGTKNSVNSSSSSISEYSSESPPRPLSSSSLSGNTENAYQQTNLQTKSKYVSHHNARYQVMPYYNNDPTKHSHHAIDNFTINTAHPFTHADLQNQAFIYNQHCQQYNEYNSYNVNQHQQIMTNYQDLTSQHQAMVYPYQVDGSNGSAINAYYPPHTSLGSNGSPCASQIPDSMPMSDSNQYNSIQYSNCNLANSHDSNFYTKKRNCSEFELSCYSNSHSPSLNSTVSVSPDDSLSSEVSSPVSKKKKQKNSKTLKDKTGRNPVYDLK
jgi:hypothetical protein